MASAPWEIKANGTGVNIQGQLSVIIADPIGYAIWIGRDLIGHAAHYGADTVGIFGAWTVYLPIYIYILAITAFVMASLFPVRETPKLDFSVILWYLALITASVVLIETACYVLASLLQGRYLLPLGALAAATVSSVLARQIPRARAELVYLLVLAGILHNTVMMDVTIITGYHLF